MKNIPVFTTASGVASLTLREIPYKGVAYIRIQDSCQPEQLLNECIDFCRSAGAEYIYATGNEILEQFPFYTAIWKMTRQRAGLPDTAAALFPVQEKTLNQWLDIFNSRMRDIPNSATMTVLDGQEMLKKGDGYFVHKEDVLLGIGKASGGKIDAIISIKPGMGRDVLLALNKALTDDCINVEVASANSPAINLYRKLGFIKTAELANWYKVF